MGAMFNMFRKDRSMKPWIKKTLAAFFGATILVGGLAACSGGAHRHAPLDSDKMAEVRGKVIDRVSHKLDLNDVQKQKLVVLADKVQAQRSAVIGKTTDPRAEMQAIVAGNRFDRSRAQGLLEEKTRAVQASGPEVINALADFYDSLDAEQQQKVRDWMHKRRSGWMVRS